ncbi:SDR family NAD(P)-dependent oxidoreductase [Nocardia rhamnosiphila]|uniref:SDR family NAD(P)-dependent oxidoreductase n=1 Tax=Nocardia rhamnosiphila TaxID=426716 RepID=UPI00068A48CF|nr:SDR family NAD(P)-dependent oxidoreductase [Nocardia rhamnosiphila]
MHGIPRLLSEIGHGLDTHVGLPRLRRSPDLSAVAAGRTVLITGASSGIGRAAAVRIGAAGARVALVARRKEELEEVAAEIRAAGGTAGVHPCDLNDFAALDAAVATVLAEYGGVDILINNAGRSIRRRLDESYDRFHDFERTMRLNYFAALRLMLAVLPGMRERRAGHIVNILSVANLFGGPGYSAYVASKAALDSLTADLHAETLLDGIHFSSVYMPLVRTPMIAPNARYRDTAALTPEQGAQIVCRTLTDRPRHVGPLLGRMAALVDIAFPDRSMAGRSARFARGM